MTLLVISLNIVAVRLILFEFLKIVQLKDIRGYIQEEVIELQNNSNFKDSFKSDVSLVEV